MFRRVLLDDWQYTLAAALFLATAVVFVLFLVASWRMKTETADRLAHAPLADDHNADANPSASSHELRA